MIQIFLRYFGRLYNTFYLTLLILFQVEVVDKHPGLLVGKLNIKTDTAAGTAADTRVLEDTTSITTTDLPVALVQPMAVIIMLDRVKANTMVAVTKMHTVDTVHKAML